VPVARAPPWWRTTCVIDNSGRRRAGDSGEQLFGMHAPRTTVTPDQVILKIGVPGADFGNTSGGRGGQRSATKVRMHDDARRIDDWHQ